MEKREHIICVDDEEGILLALKQQLIPFQDGCEISLAQSGQQALELLDDLEREGEPVAMVIADQIMPGMKGVDLLERVHRRLPETAKILLTGQAGLDAVVRAINHAGLNQYLAKPWDEPDLRLTVETLLAKYRLGRENARLVSDLKRKNTELLALNSELENRVIDRTAQLASANERLAMLAITDGLTGLFNHRHFYERIELEIKRSRRSGFPLSLLMIDVDHFKEFNDRFGHPAGDEALRQLSKVLADGRRAADIVARYGGEEFAIILIDTPADAAERVAQQIRQRAEEALAQQVGLGAHAESREGTTISVGVATSPDHGENSIDLLKAADKALYQAKRDGRNRVRLAVARSTATERNDDKEETP